MSSGIDWREDGQALVDLFLRARDEGPGGDAGRDMTEVVLPELLGGLCRTFPQRIADEAHGLAWIRMHQPAFLAADSPPAWLRFSVRKDLLAAVTAQKEELAAENLDLWESQSNSRSGIAGQVFDELAELLVGEGWPREVAEAAVSIIEARAELGAFTPNQLLKEMKCVPRSLREELLAFVSATDGYVYGRLSGVARCVLLERESVQGYLARLCVLPSLV